MPPNHSSEPGESGGSENPVSGLAGMLLLDQVRTRGGKNQSGSNFPTKFPRSAPANSHAMRSLEPRGREEMEPGN